MQVTLAEALNMIERGETPEKYEKRVIKLRRYINEKYLLEDVIDVLGDDARSTRKKERLAYVERMIEKLQ